MQRCEFFYYKKQENFLTKEKISSGAICQCFCSFPHFSSFFKSRFTFHFVILNPHLSILFLLSLE